MTQTSVSRDHVYLNGGPYLGKWILDLPKQREGGGEYQILLDHINGVIFLIVFLTAIVSEIPVFSQTLLCINKLGFHLLLHF